jgi:uncharacterized protein (TIRG00374 family)
VTDTEHGVNSHDTGEQRDESAGGSNDSDASGHGIEVFSAPSDAPRVRWPTDLISAGFSAVLLVLLIIVAGNGSTFDSNTLDYIGSLPGWLLWLGQAAYVVGVLYAFGLLLGVGLFARGRIELLRDMIVAAAFAVVSVLALTWLIDERWPELAFFDLTQTRETFPAFFVTTAAAIQAASSPWLSAPMRKIGWTLILAAVAASVLGGVTTMSDALGGLLVGLFAAAVVRYVFGTSAGLPSTGRIRSDLAQLGVSVETLQYFDEQPAVGVVLNGTSTDGRPLFTSVLGRDSWSTRRWTRLWREAWYHDQGSQYGSNPRQQIEHESLALLMAKDRGAPVPDLVAAGVSAHGDAMLVTDLFDHTLADVAVDDIDDEMLDAVWGSLIALHGAGISHGALDGIHVWFDSSGHPMLAGFSESAIHPSDEQMNDDLAAMLVMTTLGVGADRAIEAARRAKSDDELTATLPLLQTHALNTRLRHHVKNQKLKIKDLRKQTASAIGVDEPPLEQLTRVTWMSLLKTAFALFLGYTIIGALLDADWDTILTTLSDARWSLVLLALVLATLTNVTDSIGISAVAPKPVPIGITTLEQFSIDFIQLAVPGQAAQVATNSRYFQKYGMSTVTSVTTGTITALMSFAMQILLLLVAILVGAGSIDLSDLQGGGGVIELILVVIAVLVGVLIVVLIVPKWRAWVWSKLQQPLSQVRAGFAMLKDPTTTLKLVGTSIGEQILYGAAFAVCVLAMGGSVSLGEAIFINISVSLVTGLMPGGGAGVAEAGMAAGLTAVGVDQDVAVSAVLVYRMVSNYLPLTWGYASFRWLTKHDYL